jgi:hypothetical protein
LSQPSDYCTAYIEEVKNNPATVKESNAFKKGPEIAAVIQSVSRRLGFNSSISYGMYVLFGSKRGKIAQKGKKLYNLE